MYDERERFSIKDVVLQVILVVLFVFLLLWLFPTKSYVDNKIDSKLTPFYNQIFTTNINNMKEAAISYFTTSRLPKNIGDKERLTLSEMLDKKLLISFLDSNNKKCSLTDSYVEITKMDDEYILKVNLSCSDNSDYILVHLGCYNYCQSGLCEKQETVKTTTDTKKPSVTPVTNKQYEYEYVKRLGRYCKLQIHEVADEQTPANASAATEIQIKDKEGGRLSKYIAEDAYVIALAIDGKMPDSVELSDKINTLGIRGISHIQFIIGGSLGLADDILKRADYKLSFSKMTFPHQLMRVILLEQVYRSYRIINGEPYHK